MMNVNCCGHYIPWTPGDKFMLYRGFRFKGTRLQVINKNKIYIAISWVVAPFSLIDAYRFFSDEHVASIFRV
jgi:hypothetical protein